MDLSSKSIDSLASTLVDAYGEKEAMRTLAKMSGYEDMPPTAEEFIDDSYYLGDVLGDMIYPVWRNGLYEIFPNPFHSPYQEIVIKGCIGAGKSTFSIAGSLYDLVKILHLKDPHEHFRLVKSTKIVYGLINATMALSGSVLYDQMIDWMMSSPYFKAQMKKTSVGLLPKNIGIVSGSRPSHVLGQAVVGAILSELNFMNKVAGQAKDNYTNIVRRMQSRFMGKGGKLPGHVWLDSSNTDDESFLENHIKDSATSDQIRVYSYAVWEVKSHMGLYSGETFKVFIGSSDRDPFIVRNPKQIIGIDEARIIDVPVEFRSQFEQDINNSLRDIAGQSTVSSTSFIPSKARITNALTEENPFHNEIVKLDFFDQSTRLIDSVDVSKLLRKDKRPRFVHIDLGISGDRTGIACTRLNGFKKIERFDPITGKNTIIQEPTYTTEMALAIEAMPGQQVPIYKIKEFIIDLRQRGFPIAIVSTDGYQSTNLRQDLTLQGFKCELVSCDRTKDPYYTLKTALLEGRWLAPKHDLLRFELENLTENQQKVDHTSTSSKDLADAVCGSVWQCYRHLEDEQAAVATTSYIELVDLLGSSSGSIYDTLRQQSNGYR